MTSTGTNAMLITSSSPPKVPAKFENPNVQMLQMVPGAALAPYSPAEARFFLWRCAALPLLACTMTVAGTEVGLAFGVSEVAVMVGSAWCTNQPNKQLTYQCRSFLQHVTREVVVPPFNPRRL